MPVQRQQMIIKINNFLILSFFFHHKKLFSFFKVLANTFYHLRSSDSIFLFRLLPKTTTKHIFAGGQVSLGKKETKESDCLIEIKIIIIIYLAKIVSVWLVLWQQWNAG